MKLVSWSIVCAACGLLAAAVTCLFFMATLDMLHVIGMPESMTLLLVLTPAPLVGLSLILRGDTFLGGGAWPGALVRSHRWLGAAMFLVGVLAVYGWLASTLSRVGY